MNTQLALNKRSGRSQESLHYSAERGTCIATGASENWPCSSLAFGALCLFIAAASVHDALLVVANHGTIAQAEQNPLGRWLIELGRGDIWLFVAAKLVGTAIVCSLLVSIYRWRPPIAFWSAGCIACFQLALLSYLTFA